MVPSMLKLWTRFNRSDIVLLGDMVDSELTSEGPTYVCVADVDSLLCSVRDYALSGLCTGAGRGNFGKSDVSEVDLHMVQDDDVSPDVCSSTKRGASCLDLSSRLEDDELKDGGC